MKPVPMNRPNILIINTHDSGCHFGCYGVPSVHTPAIDRLASEGMRFTNMFSTSSICSPSRGSLLTGLYPQNSGLVGLAGPGWGYELKDSRTHLSHVLRDAGYTTALFGIQHETGDITSLGFDQVVPAARTRGEGEQEMLPPDPRDPYEAPLHNTAVMSAPKVAAEVAAFLEGDTASKAPFYIQVGLFETHTPYLWDGCDPDDSLGTWVPPYIDEQNDEEAAKLLQHITNLQGSVRRVDEAVATILSALESSGREQDTLVLFTSDHGPELPRAKWTMYDPGTHIAFILRWPDGGITGGHTCDALLSNIDFVPTLSELIGVTPPVGPDGVSFAAALRDDGAGEFHEAVYGLNFYNKTYAARTTRHRIIRNIQEKSFGRDKLRVDAAVPAVELYDVVEDPLERRSLADDPAYADVRAEMEGVLRGWLEGVDDPVLGEM